MNRNRISIIGIGLCIVVMLTIVGALITSPRQPALAGLNVEPVVVDHTSVALFDSIPEEYIAAARALRIAWWDKSVGGQLSDALSKLQLADPRYNRANWRYQMWPASGCGGWYDVAACFYAQAGPLMDQYDILSFQYSYLEVGLGSTINQYWRDTNSVLEANDHMLFLMDHGKSMVLLWTTSLSRDSGSAEATAFNATMREYSRQTGHALFDMAAILSHKPDGTPCYDNRDGVHYKQPNTDPPKEENYPDDGRNEPAICGEGLYTVEAFGGHLTALAKDRVARALWVLMAQLAGWVPNAPEPEPSAVAATPTLPVVPTNSPLPTPLDSPLPTPAPATPTLVPEPTIVFVTPTTDPTEPPTPAPSATPVPVPTQPTVTPTFTPIPSPAPSATPTPTATATATVTPVPPALCPLDGRTAATVGAALQLWLETWPMAERYRDAANGSGSIEPLTPAEVSALITACWSRANVAGAGYYRSDR